MFWDDPRDFFEKFGFTALHAIAAWALLAPFWMVILYIFALPVLREALRRQTLVRRDDDPGDTVA
jgi:hypothetical protein